MDKNCEGNKQDAIIAAKQYELPEYVNDYPIFWANPIQFSGNAFNKHSSKVVIVSVGLSGEISKLD